MLLLNSPVLCYYEGDTELSLLGQIDLNTVSEVRPSILRDAPPNALDLVGEEKVYTVAADSFDEMARWAFVINREINRLKDQAHVRSIGDNLSIDYETMLMKRVEFPPSLVIESIMGHLRLQLTRELEISHSGSDVLLIPCEPDVVTSVETTHEADSYTSTDDWDEHASDSIANTQSLSSSAVNENDQSRQPIVASLNLSLEQDSRLPTTGAGAGVGVGGSESEQTVSKPYEALLNNFFSRVLRCLYTPEQKKLFANLTDEENQDASNGSHAAIDVPVDELGIRFTR